LLGYA